MLPETRLRLRLVRAGLAVLALLLAACPAEETQVACPEGEGQVACLVDAIRLANDDPSRRVEIVFGGTVVLVEPDEDPNAVEGLAAFPSIRGVVSIRGASGDPAADALERSTDAEELFRLFHVAPGGRLGLRDLTLRNGFAYVGNAGVDGGAIRNDGMLLLRDVHLEGNYAIGDGGAVRNGSVLLAHGATFRANYGRDGGGLKNGSGGVAWLVASHFVDNVSFWGLGGAVANTGGAEGVAFLSIDSCLLESNFARDGGAIANEGGGVMEIRHSTLRANSASDDGGAILNQGEADRVAEITVERSAIVLNDAGQQGGGIQNLGVMSLSSSTLADNVAGSDGGGLRNGDDETSHASLACHHCTITANEATDEGGGIRLRSGTLRLANSILSGNQAGRAGPDCATSRPLVGEGSNLLGSSAACDLRGPVSAGDALLEALVTVEAPGEDHHPLGEGSAALGAGDPAFCGPGRDQLGRPRGEACDLGAVEAE